MEKQCLDCGTLLKGRSDKKFCDDQCRSSYNNRQKAGVESVIRPINAILRRNHAILNALSLRKKIIVGREELLKMGFDFGYHTGCDLTGEGIVYTCYDRGFRECEDRVILSYHDGHSRAGRS